MTPRLGRHASLALVTGLIAFVSIGVAALMASRLGDARAALRAELQQCACCQDLGAGGR